MNCLFICSANLDRSPTAENIFADFQGVNTISAGTNRDAEVPLSEELVQWADKIFVMEPMHLNKLRKKFRTVIKDQSIITLGIPDHYKYMTPELIEILKKKVTPHLPIPRSPQ